MNCIEKSYALLFGTNGKYQNLDPNRVFNLLKNCSDDQRIAFKIWVDPYYKSVFEVNCCYQDVLDAGFFDDNVLDSYFLNPYEDCRKLLTPFHLLQANLDILKTDNKENKKQNVVLLTTGSFAPIHIGHIAMMEKAKEAVEQNGFNVLGGYMSPSHDNYVSLKDEGRAKMHVIRRIEYIETALSKSTWIQADPWEGLYNSVAINFTDVITYLENYLNTIFNLEQPIRVFYVFGSDYLNFSQAFAFKGGCVIVPRTGYDIGNIKAKINSFENPNIFISNPSVERKISSSSIRRGQLNALPENLIGHYTSNLEIKNSEEFTIALRNDSNHSLLNWLDRQGIVDKYNSVFRNRLKEAISSSYHINIVKLLVIDTNSQKSIVKYLESKGPVLSLDPICSSEYNLRMSRVFALAGNQITRLKMSVEENTMQSQLESLDPAKTIYLVDDDIITGNTVNHVLENYIPNSSSVEVVSLFDYGNHTNDAFNKVYEVLDERDFLFGSKDGGLVIELPDSTLARVPYILPFVNPVWRCQVNADQALSFSKQILLANLSFFIEFPTLQVKDTDSMSKLFFNYVGYEDNVSMVTVVSDYWNLLSRYPGC